MIAKLLIGPMQYKTAFVNCSKIFCTSGKICFNFRFLFTNNDRRLNNCFKKNIVRMNMFTKLYNLTHISRLHMTLAVGGTLNPKSIDQSINPYMTNGFSHHCHLGEPTMSFRGVSGDFYVLSYFSMKFLCANRIAPDGTPRSAASHLGLFCLPMSHKRDARLMTHYTFLK